jgi:hypothetical protein
MPTTKHGLRAIDDWIRWFRTAHRERIEACVPEEERARELATIDAIATALHERMRHEFLARTPTP